MSKTFAAVVLAAGASRRMGANKVLLPIDGKPMLLGVVESLSNARIHPITVVTGHDREAIERVLAGRQVEFVHNDDHSHGGMLSSVKVGLNALRMRADAIFIVLGDQPLVKPATLDALQSRWRDSRPPVLRPVHLGKHGHPIVIAAECIDAIGALPPDATLNTFVAPRAVNLDVSDPATILDVDTPDDYQRITSRPSPREA